MKAICGAIVSCDPLVCWWCALSAAVIPLQRSEGGQQTVTEVERRIGDQIQGDERAMQIEAGRVRADPATKSACDRMHPASTDPTC